MNVKRKPVKIQILKKRNNDVVMRINNIIIIIIIIIAKIWKQCSNSVSVGFVLSDAWETIWYMSMCYLWIAICPLPESWIYTVFQIFSK